MILGNKFTQAVRTSLSKRKIKRILNSDKIVPVWAYLWVTRRCNLSCPYCYVKDNEAPEMTTEEAKLIIDKLKKMGCRMVAFMGGEPTLRKDFLDLIEYVKRKRMVSYLPTNGTLLTDRYIKKLVDAGLNFINLAVDSVNELNKQKVWKKQLIDKLVQEQKGGNIKIVLNIAVSKTNISEIPEILELCQKKNILIAIRIISKPRLAEEIKQTSDKIDNEIFFSKDSKKDIDAINRLAEFLAEKKKQGYPISTPLEYFSQMKKFIKEKCDWPCCAGKFTLDINNDGKILICSSFLKPLDIKFLDLKEEDRPLIETERKKKLKICNNICLSPAQFCTSYYLHHPEEFFIAQSQ